MTEYYLCILDFEATCWDNSANREQIEIIEFPSVLYKINELDKTITFISEFGKYVKPTINPKLSKFCIGLTGIKQQIVDLADTIEIVYLKHFDWLEQHVPLGCNFIIGTCGNWDLAIQLPREISNKDLN